MSKKIFVVPWILVFACAPGLFPAESAVQTSADKVIKINYILTQGDLVPVVVSASGTPIGNGIVITNRHVFENDDEMREAGFDMSQPASKALSGCYVTESRTIQFPLKLKKMGTDDDVAIMEADLRSIHNVLANTPWDAKQHRDLVSLYAILIEGIPIAAKELAVNDPLHFAGFPFGGLLVVNAGTLTRSSASDILCSGRVERGMSGGAILNDSGDLVGFVAMKNFDYEKENWVEGPVANVIKKLK